MKTRTKRPAKKRLSRPNRPTILTVAVHPDDDILGCAGTIIRYLIAGYRVVCVFLTRGERGGASGAVRAKEAVAALKSLGVSAGDIHFGPFKDGRVQDSHATIVFLERFAGPEVVAAFVPPANDHHQDHRYASMACLAALRHVPSILSYNTPSAIGFMPNVFIDITDHLGAKWAALKCHKSQMLQQKTFMEYEAVLLESMAMGLRIRVKYAEGFQSIRFRQDPCPVGRAAEQKQSKGNFAHGRARIRQPAVGRHEELIPDSEPQN